MFVLFPSSPSLVASTDKQRILLLPIQWGRPHLEAQKALEERRQDRKLVLRGVVEELPYRHDEKRAYSEISVGSE